MFINLKLFNYLFIKVMELSDYDILGVNPKSTFRQVKHAYYDLARLYHPDSAGISKKITKREREYAIKKINRAYENIKRKMNVVEVDLPQEDKKYEPLNIDFANLKLNENENENENEKQKKFNEKFNKKFEEIHKILTEDDPFSIHYKEPEESKKTKNSSKIIESTNIKKQKLSKKTNLSDGDVFEFGINYIHDHSGSEYSDIRHIQNEISSQEMEKFKLKYNNSEKSENSVDKNIENKNVDVMKSYEKMLLERNKDVVLTLSEEEFIKKQDELKKEIMNSKKNIHIERMKKLNKLN